MNPVRQRGNGISQGYMILWNKNDARFSFCTVRMIRTQ